MGDMRRFSLGLTRLGRGRPDAARPLHAVHRQLGAAIDPADGALSELPGEPWLLNTRGFQLPVEPCDHYERACWLGSPVADPAPDSRSRYAASGSRMRVQAKGGAGDTVRPSHCMRIRLALAA